MSIDLPKPKPRNYDVLFASEQALPERIRASAVAWAEDGYGPPSAVLLFYLFKMCVYVVCWLGFCQFNADPPSLGRLESWFTQTAFLKALMWSMCFEILGLGCGSGPLTGRYLPPFGGVFYFCRRGTIRLPLSGEARLYIRGWLDVFLYAVQVCMLLGGLLCATPNQWLLMAIVLNLLVLYLRDRTVFLAARGEHYWVMIACMLFEGGWFTGIIAVQLSLWLWAAVSKLTPHFPTVIAVMTSNAPYAALKRLRHSMYRNFPSDLRPSRRAHQLSRIGIAIECVFPLCLCFGDGGPFTLLGLCLMVLFHCFIVLHFPMGVPLEWNLMMIYGGFFCFSSISSFQVVRPEIGLLCLIGASTLFIPALGNLKPHLVSF